jgi:hypothetical protein
MTVGLFTINGIEWAVDYIAEVLEAKEETDVPIESEPVFNALENGKNIY